MSDSDENTVEPVVSAELSDRWHGCHQLFVSNDPNQVPPAHEIHWFTIERHSDAKGRENGGKMYRASDYPDLEAIAETFGGGAYVFRAVHDDPSRRGQIIAQRGHTISEDDYPPLPFFTVRTRAKPKPKADAVVAAPSNVAEQMLAIMQAQNAEHARRMDEERATREKERAENRQMFLTLATPLIGAAAAALTAFISRPAAAASPPAEGTKEAYIEGMEFASELLKMKKGGGDDDGDDFGGTLKGAADFLRAVQGLGE